MSAAANPYVALVRQYHPTGWPRGFFAACVKREGGKRMSTICAHQHTTHDEAAACADRLLALRTR